MTILDISTMVYAVYAAASKFVMLSLWDVFTELKLF